MNPLWVAPVAILAVGMAVVLYVARDAARAARELDEAARRFGELRTPLAELAEQSDALESNLRRRRPK